MSYVAAGDRYDQMRYNRCGRSGLALPADLARALAELRRRHPLETGAGDRAPRIRSRRHATSTSRTTTARRYGSAEENFGRIMRDDLRPYRDELVDLDQGGLRHVAGPLRRRRLAEVPAREPRPEPRAAGARLRRHLLLAPRRPATRRSRRRWARSTRRAAGQGALCRHLVLLAPRRPARRTRSSATSARRS